MIAFVFFILALLPTYQIFAQQPTIYAIDGNNNAIFDNHYICDNDTATIEIYGMYPYDGCGSNDMECIGVELYQDGVLVFTGNPGWYYADYIATFAPGDYVFSAVAYYESSLCSWWNYDYYTTTSNLTLHVVGPNSSILPTVPIIAVQSGNSLCVSNNNMYFSANGSYSNNATAPTYSGDNPTFIWKKNGGSNKWRNILHL